MRRGSDDENTYEFTYDNAGRVSRMTYSYDPGFDYGCSYKGTVTYSYDAEGKTVAVNGDFTGEPNEETKGNAFKQTFRLTAVSGNVTE